MRNNKNKYCGGVSCSACTTFSIPLGIGGLLWLVIVALSDFSIIVVVGFVCVCVCVCVCV